MVEQIDRENEALQQWAEEARSMERAIAEAVAGERIRIIAAIRQPDAELHYVMKEALAKAYRDGATDVHNAWENDEHSREPDFGEAASDYGSHHATAALSAAADHMEAGDAN